MTYLDLMNIITMRDLSYEEYLLMKLEGDIHFSDLCKRYFLNEQIIRECFDYLICYISFYEYQTIPEDLVIKYYDDINLYEFFKYNYLSFDAVKQLKDKFEYIQWRYIMFMPKMPLWFKIINLFKCIH